MQKCRLRPILRSHKQTKLKMRQRENLLLSFHLTLNYLNKFRPTIFFLSKTFFTMHNYILHGQGNQFLRNCARIFFFFYLIAARNRVQELGGSRHVFDPNVIKKRKSQRVSVVYKREQGEFVDKKVGGLEGWMAETGILVCAIYMHNRGWLRYEGRLPNPSLLIATRSTNQYLK